MLMNSTTAAEKKVLLGYMQICRELLMWMVKLGCMTKECGSTLNNAFHLYIDCIERELTIKDHVARSSDIVVRNTDTAIATFSPDKIDRICTKLDVDCLKNYQLEGVVTLKSKCGRYLTPHGFRAALSDVCALRVRAVSRSFFAAMFGTNPNRYKLTGKSSPYDLVKLKIKIDISTSTVDDNDSEFSICACGPYLALRLTKRNSFDYLLGVDSNMETVVCSSRMDPRCHLKVEPYVVALSL